MFFTLLCGWELPPLNMHKHTHTHTHLLCNQNKTVQTVLYQITLLPKNKMRMKENVCKILFFIQSHQSYDFGMQNGIGLQEHEISFGANTLLEQHSL